jgi:putative membrane protein
MLETFGMDTAFGPLSLHMLQHVVVMNLIVPAAVFGLSLRGPSWLWKSWPLATACQLALLWIWHAPPALAFAMSQPAAMIAMHFSLALAALWFWMSIASAPPTGRWRAIFALIVTGKLFCLLGALLVFAPRQLFDMAGHAHHMAADGLADQQLAGLIMLTACPLSYVFIGIVISTRWFLSLEREAQNG